MTATPVESKELHVMKFCWPVKVFILNGSSAMKKMISIFPPWTTCWENTALENNKNHLLSHLYVGAFFFFVPV
jgi:hypothetical protein